MHLPCWNALATFVPSLPQGSPGVKGAIGPVGPPGASVSGPPVRVLFELYVGVLLGPTALLLGGRPTLPIPAAWGLEEERPQLGPTSEKEDPTVLGEDLTNDNADHHFLSCDCAEALC